MKKRKRYYELSPLKSTKERKKRRVQGDIFLTGDERRKVNHADVEKSMDRLFKTKTLKPKFRP